MIENIVLISIKIPRTGSSTFGNILKKAFPNSDIGIFIKDMKYNPIIYDPDSWFYKDDNPAEKFQNELADYTTDQLGQCIHNHVPVTFFDGILKHTPRIAFMREPISWLISCYWYAKALSHIPKEMSIWDYIELDYRRNWMSMLMGDSIDRFSYIGFQETWLKDTANILRKFAFIHNPNKLCNKKTPKRNVMDDEEYISFRANIIEDRSFIKRCKELHENDFKLYKIAKKEKRNDQ